MEHSFITSNLRANAKNGMKTSQTSSEKEIQTPFWEKFMFTLIWQFQGRILEHYVGKEMFGPLKDALRGLWRMKEACSSSVNLSFSQFGKTFGTMEEVIWKSGQLTIAVIKIILDHYYQCKIAKHLILVMRL